MGQGAATEGRLTVSGHVMLRPRSDAVLEARVASQSAASTRRRHPDNRRSQPERFSWAKFVAMKPTRLWVSEADVAGCSRARSLLEDNPTSG